MAESTTKKNWQKVKDLMEYHKETFKELGLDYAAVSYIPKMFYTPSGKDEMYVSFFLSQLRPGVDIYTEMVDRDYESEDPERTLYKWTFNPQWETEYEKTDNAPIRYLIPVRELKIISVVNIVMEAAAEPADTGDCGPDDCGLEEMSMRDLYAIIQNRPVSSKKWLNELILQLPRL